MLSSFEGFDARMRLAGYADGKAAINGLVTSGGFNVRTAERRCSIIAKPGCLTGHGRRN